MKLSATIAIAAAGTLAAAQGHRHAHHHAHKRDTVATSTVDEVVTVYQLDGTPVPVADVCQGIKNGEYKWADGNAPSGACATSTSTSPTVKAAEFIQTSTSVSTSTSSSSIVTTSAVPTTSATPTTSSTSTTPTTTPATSTTPSATPAPTSGSGGATGVDAPFPDGELDCDTFPSQYGAVPLDYHNIGGWSGIQYPTFNSLATLVENIVTAVQGQSCTEGAFCSYQCPEGYLKSQWPSTQGATGQSVGGIRCSNGKLVRTNTNYDTLCIPGVPALSVKNTLSEMVCLCRTDYPGTESETLPSCVNPGQTIQLANPDGNSYYEWEGKSTSAQYYINPAGFDETQACIWGSPDPNPIGNFAPMNLGLGYKNGVTFASIFPNKPTTSEILQYNVRYDGVSTECAWDSNAKAYKGGASADGGCTVSIPEGSSATLVLY
ncbi:SUN domain protein (Uth1), putative [Talaromyces stipitatus ATCC 10500]|uniref:SUN domain protein (Uth1), putative n=1 Tax=Talaromyces stipitatus (strain ATCC 10500 / CBS 375.48 / QM 6759 / NRRL 1006) TaxID=441959 RepID=B8MIX7_TALSN|nr:SUN domain protein (Uth1), putative [Talaromyces stipitatus ATCC 10500]EED15639.1 SUN domain protein (Uth1), putative [Talaromyces stipitatus ATCC 10500]